jgi:phosphoglycerol transferase MdoB-like AlkP superfamily enzyme
MRARLKIFGLLVLFWMIFFTISRLVFFAYNFDQTSKLTLKEILTALALGLRMDAAMTGYWLILPGILFSLSPWLPNKASRKLLHSIVMLLLFISTAIIVIDLELYRNWGFRMNTTPLMYAGSEGIGSASVAALINLPIIFIGLFGVFAFAYHKVIAKRLLLLSQMKRRGTLILLLLTVALFIPIRSSFSVAPLNTGVVFFHNTKMFPNHAGINVVWNFSKSLTSGANQNYPEDFYPLIKARKNLEAMTKSDSTIKVLRPGKPNILLIILESFTSKVIEPLGGRPGVTPQLNQLFSEGISFTRFYSSGDRTDKGIVSLLSGYPAQPRSTIIKFPEKTQHLPYLPKALKHLGYTPTFVYGGDVGFANMESYLTMSGFEHITEDDDFDEGESKWGVHDHIVFNRLLKECDSARTPFFKVMLTLSSHEPFDVPHASSFTGKDDISMFLNACHYTDSTLGLFIGEARKKSWWENTLVVITADHGHLYPDPGELNASTRFKIPMLWLGGALTTSDTISTIASQTDIANTLLAQLEVADAGFPFSKNILSPDVKPFAVYVFNNGYGYLSESSESTYDFDLHDYIRKTGSEEEWNLGRSYMQALFSDYNKR